MPRAEGEGEGEAEGAAPDASDSQSLSRVPRSSPCRSSVGAEAAPTLDLLVVGLGNPVESTSRSPQHRLDGDRRARTPSRRHVQVKFSGRLAEPGSGGAVALLKPETYMNDSGRALAAPARSSEAPVSRSCRRTTTSISRRPASRLARAVVWPGTTVCGRLQAALGSQEFSGLRIGVGRPGRGDRAPSPTMCSRRLRLTRTRTRSSPAPPTPSSCVRDGLEETQRQFN